MAAALLSKFFCDNEQQFIYIDDDDDTGHDQQEDECGEIKALEVAMPLLEWLDEQRNRKAAESTHKGPASNSASGNGKLSDLDGDATAVNRFVTAALMRNWTFLPLHALVALVRVLALECGAFMTPQMAEEVAIKTAAAACALIERRKQSMDLSLIVELTSCLLRLLELSGASGIINPMRNQLRSVLAIEDKLRDSSVFGCLRMTLQGSPIVVHLICEFYQALLSSPPDMAAISGRTRVISVADVLVLLAISCIRERRQEAYLLVMQLISADQLCCYVETEEDKADTDLVTQIVNIAAKSSAELIDMLREMAMFFICDHWYKIQVKQEPGAWLKIENESERVDSSGLDGDDDITDTTAEDASLTDVDHTDDIQIQMDLGKALICKIFEKHEPSRSSLFELLFQKAGDPTQPREIHESFTSILANTTHNQPRVVLTLLEDNLPCWAEYCSTIPSDMSYHILQALLPLCSYSDSFSRELLNFIATAMVEGDKEFSRNFAVRGLCALLASPPKELLLHSMHGVEHPMNSGSPLDSLVHQAFTLPLSSKKPFYDSLYAMFEDFVHDPTETPDDMQLEETATLQMRTTLQELLLKQASPYFHKSFAPRTCLAILSVFETRQPSRDTPSVASTFASSSSATAATQYSLHVHLRELLPELLRCLAYGSSPSSASYATICDMLCSLFKQMVECNEAPFQELTGFIGIEGPDNTTSITPTKPTAASVRTQSKHTDMGGNEMKLCPSALISLRQRMIILAPLYEAITDCVLRLPTLFEGSFAGAAAAQKATELLEIRTALLSVVRSSAKRSLRRQHYATLLHTDGYRFTLERPLLSMNALLHILDLQLNSKIRLSPDALKDVLNLITRHLSLRPKDPSHVCEGAIDMGILVSRWFALYVWTLNHSTSREPLFRAAERKEKDETVSLRKALVRGLGYMLNRLNPARMRTRNASHERSIFASLNASVKEVLPLIEAEDKNSHCWVDDDTSSRSEPEAAREGKRVREACNEMYQGQRISPRRASGAESSSADAAHRSGTIPVSTKTIGQLECMALLGYFFALQAQKDKMKSGYAGLMREYIRTVGILADLCFADQPSALLRDEWQWDRQRRRCLIWIRKTMLILWTFVQERSKNKDLMKVPWPFGRSLVKFILNYSFALNLNQRQRFINDIIASLYLASTGPAPDVITKSAFQSANMRNQQKKEIGFVEISVNDILSHHLYCAAQAMRLFRSQPIEVPPIGILHSLRLMIGTIRQLLELESLPTELSYRIPVIASKMVRLCAEVARMLTREMEKSEQTKKPDHKALLASRHNRVLPRTPKIKVYGNDHKVQWTPAVQELAEKLLVDGTTLVIDVRNRSESETTLMETDQASKAIISFLASTNTLTSALRKLARLTQWQESASGKRLGVLLEEIERDGAIPDHQVNNPEEEEEDSSGKARRQHRSKRRRHEKLPVVRSRNSFIDAELRKEGGCGDDSFADLEDFIVCPKGPVIW